MRNLSCLPCATGRKPSARFVCLKSLSLPYILHLFGSDNPGKLPESRNYFIAFALGKFLIFSTNGTVTNEGTFSLYKNVSNLEHYERVYIDFSNAPDQMIVNNEEKTLILSDDVNDGYTYTYKKK
jgi:hypothetical protein